MPAKPRIQRIQEKVEALPPAPPPPTAEELAKRQARQAQMKGSGRRGLRPGQTVSPTPYLPDLKTDVELALFAAGLERLAYSAPNDTIYNQVKTMIGASEISFIDCGAGDLCPNGIRVTYPDKVIYAIRGTTNAAQAHMYQLPLGMEDMYMTTNGMATAGNAPSENRTGLFYMGHYYVPFYLTGQPWATKIGKDIIDHYRGRDIYLIGHSLGAAICEVVGNIFSWAYSSFDGIVTLTNQAGASGQVNYRSYMTFPQQLKGGFVFGCPKIVDYNGRHYRWQRGVRRLVGPDVNQTGVNFAELTSQIQRFDHPADPICTIPCGAGGVPILYIAAGATYGSYNPQRNTSRVSNLGNFSASRFQEQFPTKCRLPATVSEFTDRAEVFHTVDQYLAIFKTAYGSVHELSQEWEDFLALCQGLTILATNGENL